MMLFITFLFLFVLGYLLSASIKGVINDLWEEMDDILDGRPRTFEDEE